MTEKKTDEINWFGTLLLMYIQLNAIAYLIMIGVGAFGGPDKFGYLDYLSGVAGAFAALRILKMALS